MKTFRTRLLPVFAAACILISLFSPTQASVSSLALPGDEYWEEGFTLAGVNGPVYAIARSDDGNIYIGGDFTTAGGVMAQNLAWWDGARWHGVPGTYNGFNGPVYALEYDSTNQRLYAGGNFTQAGSATASYLAVSNNGGSTWLSLGGGTDGEVYALKMDTANNMLYVGGKFTSLGAISASFIVRRDLTNAAWKTLGSGTNSPVNAIDVVDGTVYAGGSFTTAGGIAANRVASYTISSGWAALGEGVNGAVYALEYANNKLYAGGIITLAGESEEVNLAVWDGAAWEDVAGGANHTVFALASVGTTLYAGGTFSEVGDFPQVGAGGIATLNTSTETWSAIGSGVGGMVRSIFVYVTPKPLMIRHVLVGGLFSSADDTQTANIIDYSNSKWNRFADQDGPGALLKGHNESINALARDSKGRLYAAFCKDDFQAGYGYGVIQRWEGAHWAYLTRPNNSFGCYTTLIFGPNDVLYAAGKSFEASDPNAHSGKVFRWDGTTWTDLGDLGGAIHALAIGSGGVLYAGGDFAKDGAAGYDHVVKWNGSAWQQVGTGLKGIVYTLAVSPVTGSLYAGGQFTSTGDGPANNIARFDTSWHALGAGTNGSVMSIAIDRQDRVYAGGYFSKANNTTVNRIAYWDGAWHGLGGGASGNPSGLGFIGVLRLDRFGRLYAAGDFDNIGGIEAKHAARWDGAQWSALGSGFHSNGNVTNFCIISDIIPDDRLGVYFSGSISQAGADVASNIAYWNDSSRVYLPSLSK